jgi:FKBP-type peptidyl-prolyl cis-trans isomerase 2
MIKKTLDKLIADNAKLDKKARKVEKWHAISVHYIGRLDDKEVFDTSREEIAKACGKYMSWRNYNEWLAFTVGAGQMIAGFDKGVEGMIVWETKTIIIPAAEAYGEWTWAALIPIKKNQLPEWAAVKWTKLMVWNGQQVTVYSVDWDDVVLDTNHELAGKNLIFDITILEITK